MIHRWIDWCARNRFLVFTGTLLLVLAGIYSLRRIPLDALPDISDVEVIIFTQWPGEPPNIIEDQITYPIVTTMLAAPRVKAVRAQTMFGDSYVFVIFQDGTDLYWARSRVSEYLQQIQGQLPPNVHPVIGPDATGAGWVYEYVLVDHNHQYSLADLRTLQDWYLRYQLETVPGVAEVATIGGFVKQFQVNLDPDKLRAYNIQLSRVIDRVRESTNEVGSRLLELGGAEYMVRGLGYFNSLQDLDDIPVSTTSNGIPVLVSDLGTVSYGPDIRRGVAEWNGQGETVGGIVVMRYGMNALNVINNIKRKLAEIRSSLPPGIEIKAGYDRSGLIQASIATLKRDLLEEIIVVSLVIIIFLFHFRSALIPIVTIPLAVIGSFVPMYYLHVSSNIMSLGGLALAIGVLVDAAIVMVENGYRHLSERQLSPSAASSGRSNDLSNAHNLDESGATPPPLVTARERRRILIAGAKEVGPALFFSLVIIVVSFLPVFLLEAQEGRMFKPLTWTKTLSISISSILSITLVPVLMLIFIRGKLRPESENPVSRFTQAIYLPILRLCLRYRKTALAISLALLALAYPLARRIGSQFMPPLFEGSLLYMPTALPGISITQASQLLQEQDRIIKSFPEVASVFGTVGRSGSATDNAPLDMYDTTIMLKPASQWPKGTTYSKLIREMDARLQFPGLTNTWTMPVENRLDMELTGIKTPVGLKVQGPNLQGIQQVAASIQQILSAMPEVGSVFAEKVAEGFYVNIQVNRAEAARYGLTIADVQRAVESGIGGEDIAVNIEG
ncbi:MAG TPA: CusA/CzcA family heavy metal efflux RND transporter, partial [Terriglobia bacterium]|nr:CusA/CzcA family heavy metal efflux RND transporter [Terriglobia bacterium]